MDDRAVKLLCEQLDNIIFNKPHQNQRQPVGEELEELEDKIIRLSYCAKQCCDFAIDMSKGNLETKIPDRDNYLSASMKSLHASLLHLNWQVTQLIKGDYTHNLDFMGEFSIAFNRIADMLKERDRDINTDVLTGGRSQTKFETDAVRIINSGGVHALALINVDRFKVFNDTFGFSTGDKLIRLIAQTIEENLDKGEIYSRYIADQFFILLNQKAGENTLERVTSILERIEEVFSWSIHKYFKLVVYAGICTIPEGSCQSDGFNYFTNKARYALKDVRGNPKSSVALYNDKMREQLVRGIEFESKMNLALKNNEFHLYLQPKYRLCDEKIVGVEALVRWIDNKHSMISPSEFIGVFEKNGFMVELDMYMLERACMLIRGWLDKNLEPVPISVNFSRLHLTNENFVDELVSIVQRTQIPSKYIEIELTESIIFDNTEQLIKVINQLHRHGFTLSMDDFGSGYSSLGLLKDLPIDVIKLDKSFFTDYIDFERGRAVVDAVISMARALGIQTVAEGVETKEHVDMLKRFKCDIVQGFYYARPMSAKDFNALMYKIG